jgi:HPt (histidine-containing phosphotransfer) domain-containing protein
MENSNKIPITNLSYLEGLSKGDKSFVKKMINVFLEENPKEVRMLEESIQSKNYDTIKSAAHKLKSTIPFVGLDTVIGKEVGEIESLATRREGYESIKTLLVKIKESSDLAYDELKVYLSRQ